MFVWDTNVPVCNGDSEWPGFRHDNRNTGAYGTDTISPGPVRDLSATSLPLSGTALHWTAPGGDGFCGKADHYEIRASSAPITGDNWDSAQLLGVMPAAAVGSQETFLIPALPSGTYYVSIRAIDRAGNVAPVSTGSPTITQP
jgi:hypothetical protein